MSETKRLLIEHRNKLQAAHDEILAKSNPLREERDRIKNEAREKALKLNAEIKAIEAPLLQIDTELAAVAKATGGRSMNERGNKS